MWAENIKAVSVASSPVKCSCSRNRLHTPPCLVRGPLQRIRRANGTSPLLPSISSSRTLLISRQLLALMEEEEEK